MDAYSYLNNISPQPVSPDMNSVSNKAKNRNLLVIMAMVASIILIIVFIVIVISNRINPSQEVEESSESGTNLFCNKGLGDLELSNYSITPQYGESNYYMLFFSSELKAITAGVELGFSDVDSAEKVKDLEAAKIADASSDLNQKQYPPASIFSQDGNILSIIMDVDLGSEWAKSAGPYAPSGIDSSSINNIDSMRNLFELNGYSCSKVKLFGV